MYSESNHNRHYEMALHPGQDPGIDPRVVEAQQVLAEMRQESTGRANSGYYAPKYVAPAAQIGPPPAVRGAEKDLAALAAEAARKSLNGSYERHAPGQIPLSDLAERSHDIRTRFMNYQRSHPNTAPSGLSPAAFALTHAVSEFVAERHIPTLPEQDQEAALQTLSQPTAVAANLLWLISALESRSKRRHGTDSQAEAAKSVLDNARFFREAISDGVPRRSRILSLIANQHHKPIQLLLEQAVLGRFR